MLSSTCWFITRAVDLKKQAARVPIQIFNKYLFNNYNNLLRDDLYSYLTIKHASYFTRDVSAPRGGSVITEAVHGPPRIRTTVRLSLERFTCSPSVSFPCIKTLLCSAVQCLSRCIVVTTAFPWVLVRNFIALGNSMETSTRRRPYS